MLITDKDRDEGGAVKGPTETSKPMRSGSRWRIRRTDTAQTLARLECRSVEGADPGEEDPRRGSGRQRGRRSAGLRRAEAGSTKHSKRERDGNGKSSSFIGLEASAIYSGPALVGWWPTPCHALAAASASPSRLRPYLRTPGDHVGLVFYNLTLF